MSLIWLWVKLAQSDLGACAQDAWGRAALHWAAAYACEASVVLLLVRGAHAAPLSHGTEAQPPLTPGDMAAAAGHVGLAAFLSEHALVQLMKDHNVTLHDPMEASKLPLPSFSEPAVHAMGSGYGAILHGLHLGQNARLWIAMKQNNCGSG